ncbi:MAG: hypothetical protein KatS3mg102_1237 [Planctomycetota bacterium]|nr:MAG: hypothetical protein KatS3mg102_1237 [Planctomycetota bacterium]
MRRDRQGSRRGAWARGPGSAAVALGVVLLGAVTALPVVARAAPPAAPGEQSGGTGRTQADPEAERRAAEARRRAEAEEMLLRLQLEAQLNQLARWDAERGRVVLREDSGLEGVPGAPLEIALEIVAEPGPHGRLVLRKDVQLRPFVLAIQRFLANGGAELLQRMQQRLERGESPLEQGVPPQLETLVAELLAALNAQDEQALTEAERAREREREQLYDRLAEVLVEGFELPREAVERRLRLVRELDRRLGRELSGQRWRARLRALAQSERTARVLERLREEAERLLEERAKEDPELERLLEQLRRRGEARRAATPSQPAAGAGTARPEGESRPRPSGEPGEY